MRLFFVTERVKESSPDTEVGSVIRPVSNWLVLKAIQSFVYQSAVERAVQGELAEPHVGHKLAACTIHASAIKSTVETFV